jgi:hypothetical protein
MRSYRHAAESVGVLSPILGRAVTEHFALSGARLPGLFLHRIDHFDRRPGLKAGRGLDPTVSPP